MATIVEPPAEKHREKVPQSGSLEISVWDKLRELKKENRMLRYKSVEEVMMPLIIQVTSLTEYRLDETVRAGDNEALRHLGASGRWLGRPHKLVQLVDKAVMNLLAVAEDIAEENSDFQTDMTVACEDVRSKEEVVYSAAAEFVLDTMVPEKRAAMVASARDLLLAVTRLLVIVDMIDVDKILSISSRIEEKLKLLCQSRDEDEVGHLMQECISDIDMVTQIATVCQDSTSTKACLQLLTSVQTDLQRSTRMLASASKVFLQCPSEKAAEENREAVLGDMLKSLKILSLISGGEDLSKVNADIDVEGQLATTFRKMEARLNEIIDLKPSKLGAVSLQKELEELLRGSADLANSSSTRDYRQRSILTKARVLKTELQDLVDILEDEGMEGGLSQQMQQEAKKLASVNKRHLKALQKELHGVCVDHISDAFISLWAPVKDLVAEAHKGRRGQVEHCAEVLEEHSAKILKAGSLSCLLCEDNKNISNVRNLSSYVSGLTTQVIRAAQTLVAQPTSTTLRKNLAIFKESWTEKVERLASSVDFMTPFIDFLTITEAHVCGDGVTLLQSMSNNEEAEFQTAAHLIKNRCGRLSHMARVEMRRNPARYSAKHKKKIKRCLDDLDNNVVAFKEHVDKMQSDVPDRASNCSLLTYAMETVVAAIRKLREEVLSGMSPEEQEENGVSDMVDTLNPLLSLTLSQMSVPGTPEPVTPRKFQRTPCHSNVFDTEDSSQNAMGSLSPDQRTQLAKATEGLSAQQKAFESQVQDWDVENDMVVLAKEMCMMVMDMSDFTRSIGPIKSMTDLLITAKDIARAGEYICSIAASIAAQCPEDKSKRDLLAYTDSMKLYCHQLKITSAVRADSKSPVQTVDSASALITAARNALNTAVELVRLSYTAAIHISKTQKGTVADQFSMWRLTLPKKKNLDKETVKKDGQDAPIHRLGQFKLDRHRQAPFV